MGSTSPQIKSLISLAYSYQVRKSEKNLAQLQRQLQILSVVSDLEIFEPTCMEILEFHVCLEQLLSESDPRSPLAWKIINLFIHMSRLPSVRIAMRDEIKLVPVLSQFLLSSKLTKHKSQTLHLLQELSYGIKIYRKEAWLLKLIPHLATIIMECDGKTDDAEAAIITLANLCRGNPPASVICREFNERKILLKTLTDLKSPNLKIQFLVTEICLQMNEMQELGQIMQTLELLFTVATEGFADHDEGSLRLAKDVFEDIVKKSDLQSCLRGFTKFGFFCQSLLSYITDESLPTCVGLLFEFISSIVNIEHPDIAIHLETLLCKVLPWIPNRKCGVGCLKLAQELIIAVDDTIISAHIDELVAKLKESLKLKDGFNVSFKEAHWMSLCLRLIESLCSRDSSFHFILVKSLTPPTLTTMIQSFLEVKDDMLPTMNGYKDVVNGYNNLHNNGIFGSSPLASSLHRSNSNCSTANDARVSTLESYSEVVVRAIAILKLLSSHDPEFKVECREMLSNSKAMQHIVCCERSSNVELVAKATNILCEDSVPSENINALIKAQRDANEKEQLLRINEFSVSNQMPLTPSVHNSSISLSSDVENNVHSLISKLNGAVEKAGLIDLPLTDVMSLYEYSLAAMAHAEKSLKESLEASDYQNRHIHHRLLQSRAESERLRELLRMWEARLQQSQLEKRSIEAQISDIKESARKFREGLIKEKAQLEREVARQYKELVGAKQENDGKDEIIKTLKKQLSEANSENKTLMEREQRFREKINRLDEEIKKNKRENEEKEKENQRFEKVVTQYKKETSELEMLIRSHEETLTEKDSQIEELTKTNMSLKRIQDMIHNISSVKTINPK